MGAIVTLEQLPMARGTRGVVILDEHPIWVDALEGILKEAGVPVVGTATSAGTALDLISSNDVEALLAPVVLESSEMEAVELFGRARERRPGLRLVAFAASDNGFSLSAAQSARVDAYLPKTASAETVVETVRACLTGERRLVVCNDAAVPALTMRELEIVSLAARGYTNAQIAQRLWVTRWTVKYHLANAYKKLGVTNRTQAARRLAERRVSGRSPCSA